MDKEMFTNPGELYFRDLAPSLAFVTCTKCGCLVTDTDIHEMFHANHGHFAYGFTAKWPQ